MKKIKFKCWVENDGGKFYGPGPNELIKQIQKEGSLSKAAGKMNMSYRKAWDIVQRLNDNSGELFVILKKGGQHGGGAEVTSYALEVMREYEKMEKHFCELAKEQNEFIKLLK
ncbi:winged helix-turn-helix domain-containing protein [Gramella sp. KN1008]|uniref:winged helix-turn-helix domain-containing protein n=1 Tax=Gramella sp. KN1008 TaxID=2529298 RepID=UPI00103B7ACE|nr:winged helix-turn-helix domain-containing protein [Gramella sp. KN1008]TBW27149.1 LysR family transcriptional regulator [Gramella sp. KN1008]